MHVMHIRHMRMRVPQRSMHMRVAVRTCRHRIVRMVVVAVVMAMGVFVLDRVMPMLVAVRLAQVEHDTGEHQRAADHHQRPR